MVTVVPPLAGPDVGLTALTTVGTTKKVNLSPLPVVLLPLGVVTVMSIVPAASAGEIAVIDVSESMVNDDAGVEPKSTAVTAEKPVPTRATTVPPSARPERGLTPVTAAAVKVN